MNPEPSPSPREALEIKITAMLLGELGKKEQAELKKRIAEDPELARLHDQLKKTIQRVAEANRSEAAKEPAAPPRLRLSDDRRAVLLKTLRMPTSSNKTANVVWWQRIPWYIPMSAAAIFICLLSLSALLLQTERSRHRAMARLGWERPASIGETPPRYIVESRSGRASQPFSEEFEGDKAGIPLSRPEPKPRTLAVTDREGADQKLSFTDRAGSFRGPARDDLGIVGQAIESPVQENLRRAEKVEQHVLSNPMPFLTNSANQPSPRKGQAVAWDARPTERVSTRFGVALADEKKIPTEESASGVEERFNQAPPKPKVSRPSVATEGIYLGRQLQPESLPEVNWSRDLNELRKMPIAKGISRGTVVTAGADGREFAGGGGGGGMGGEAEARSAANDLYAGITVKGKSVSGTMGEGVPLADAAPTDKEWYFAKQKAPAAGGEPVSRGIAIAVSEPEPASAAPPAPISGPASLKSYEPYSIESPEGRQGLSNGETVKDLDFAFVPPPVEAQTANSTLAQTADAPQLGMGVWSDYDRDGDLDLRVADVPQLGDTPTLGRLFRDQSRGQSSVALVPESRLAIPAGAEADQLGVDADPDGSLQIVSRVQSREPGRASRSAAAETARQRGLLASPDMFDRATTRGFANAGEVEIGKRISGRTFDASAPTDNYGYFQAAVPASADGLDQVSTGSLGMGEVMLDQLQAVPTQIKLLSGVAATEGFPLDGERALGLLTVESESLRGGTKLYDEQMLGEEKVSSEVTELALKEEAQPDIRSVTAVGFAPLPDVEFAAEEVLPILSELTETVVVQDELANGTVDFDTDGLESSGKLVLRQPPAAPKDAPIPTPEVRTTENSFSTFSLNVSDVSYKLAAAGLENGILPDPASIRSEEFINAFEYHDPEPNQEERIAFAWETARYPFAHNRDVVRFSVKTAASGREPGRPLNLVILLDNSGSMERADRVTIIQEALRVLQHDLLPEDRISVVTFARTARLWIDGIPGDQTSDLPEETRQLTPQGGTNLEAALALAYKTASRHYLENGINRVVLLTDGAANLGNVNPEQLRLKVVDHRKQGIALDCFGIGWEGYNDDLLETLSRNGDGRYGFINSPEDAATEFAAQLAGALQIAAADVKVQVEFNPDRVHAYRLIGYAKHQLTKEQFRDNTVDAAEIGAAEAGNALYVIAVNPDGTGPIAISRVRYRIPSTNTYAERSWTVPYQANPPSLEQASPSLRLAGTAAAFAEWLAVSPYAGAVDLHQLLQILKGVPDFYSLNARPGQLEAMLRQAIALSAQ